MTEANAEMLVAWEGPPRHPLTLEPDDVHVWRIDLDVDPARISELERLLAPPERERAGRFVGAFARQRFVAARGALRVILGNYLDLPPQQVLLSTTTDGKPVLGSGETIHFNVSHSDALALIGVTRRGEIGVDVERLRTDFDPEALARRFFAPEEYAALRQLPDAEKHRAYFQYWTGKEAFVKGVGKGLRYPLCEFAISPGDDAIFVLGATGEKTDVSSFRLRWLAPAPGYVGAVAVKGCPKLEFRCFAFPH